MLIIGLVSFKNWLLDWRGANGPFWGLAREVGTALPHLVYF